MKQPSVYAVILNYKNFSDTIRCIESLKQSDYGNLMTIVVDNNSQNESLEEIGNALDQRGIENVAYSRPPDNIDTSIAYHLVQSGENRGYAAGNNVGIKYALKNNADYVLILNNDTIVPSNFPRLLVEFAEGTLDAGIVGPKVKLRDGSIQDSCARRRICFWDNLLVFGIYGRAFKGNKHRQRYYYYNEYEFDKPYQVDIIAGCSMLMKKSLIQAIGLLDEKTFLMCEELILHEKINKTKFKTYIFPSQEILHLHGASITPNKTKFVQDEIKKSWTYYFTNYMGYPRWKAHLAYAIKWCPKKPKLLKEVINKFG